MLANEAIVDKIKECHPIILYADFLKLITSCEGIINTLVDIGELDENDLICMMYGNLVDSVIDKLLFFKQNKGGQHDRANQKD